MKGIKTFIQRDGVDCGPTCLKIITYYYGKFISIQRIRELSETTRLGSTLLNISNAAESLGFRTLRVQLSINDLDDIELPCIIHWNKNHFVVLYKIRKGRYYVSDPAHGLLRYSKSEFVKRWIGDHVSDNVEEGIALVLEPTPKFYTSEVEDDKKGNQLGFRFLLNYLRKYSNFVYQLIIGLVAASLLQLIFPFLTQSVVDIGIRNQDIDFVYLVLFAQLALFIGRTSVEVIRSWILLHLSTRINISLISDFFIKLMQLPIAFFDTRLTGDLLQRINDHRRIERIITSSSLNVLFSTSNLIVFGIVLAYYSSLIFYIFLGGSILYFVWISIFLKRRASLDYIRFSEISEEQSKVIELINGMQEIKLHNAEKQKRWAWESLQARLFKISIAGLKLEQYQSVGSAFINEVKNIIITVLSAKLVIEGELTLGMMLAISYIVGQLNLPISQLINFIRELQDARISMDRLSEIHSLEDENTENLMKKIELPDGDFIFEEMSFRYPGTEELVLNNLSFTIPKNKITAIVGVSGSGKTTLLKMLLKFYTPVSGNIRLGKVNLKDLTDRTWRENIGVVMQEGYIFNDTIAGNIAVGDSEIDKIKLLRAVETANIKSYIESLPMTYNTKIGLEGIGLSTGQKQRLLIARAVYKNPDYIFFDEATSALDANNELTIMKNLDTFFDNRTVFIIAHRLSTVRNADQIIVLDNGEVVEIGTHDSLVSQKGHYFKLVRNQIELNA